MGSAGGRSLSLPLRDTLRADVCRYGVVRGLGRDARDMLSAFFAYPGFRYTYLLRKVAYYATRRRGLGLVPYAFYRLLLHRYRFRYGFDISPTMKIGPGLFLGHFGGVVLSPHAVLGANVNIGQGVTIGATSRGSRVGAPILGDRVWVGAHAVLVGKITVGDEALIAPGAYVNFDVPPRAVVLGNPGQVVAHTGSEGYINNVLER